MEHDCASALELRRAAVLNSNNLAAMSSPAIKSSNVDDEGRPRPQFFTESVTFSTKKEKATPRSIVPPRPPIKSCPPVSRLRPVRKNENEGARVVSFVNNDINNSLIRVKSITSNNDENDDSSNLRLYWVYLFHKIGSKRFTFCDLLIFGLFLNKNIKKIDYI